MSPSLSFKALLTAAAFSLLAAPARAEDFLLDLWDLQDGLPQISAHAVVQDHQDFLWVGTEEGLARFDGLTLQLYKPSSGLHVRALLPDVGGGLWIGSPRGVYRLDGDELTAVGGPMAEIEVSSLAKTPDGRVWAGTVRGLARVNRGSVERVPSAPEGTVRSLTVDSRGNLWLGGEAGLFRRDSELGWLLQAAEPMTAFHEDRSGRHWVGTENGLKRHEPGSPHLIPSALTTPVRALHEDRHGVLWIATDNGLYRRVDGPDGANFIAVEGLPDRYARDLWEDDEGSLWVGMRYGGLARLRRARMTTFGHQEGLAADLVWGFLEDRDGRIWVATDDGLTRWDKDGKLTLYKKNDGLPTSAFGALYQDQKGDLWIGTFGEGIVRMSNGSFRTYGPDDGVPNVSIRRFIETKDGDLWIATSDGILRFRNQVFSRFGLDDGLPHHQVRDLWEDPEGRLWVASDGGLTLLEKNNETVSLTAVEGTPAVRIKVLHGDAAGNLWIGTRNQGLFWYRDGRFNQVTTRDGLFNDYVQAIVEDGQGGLWMPSNVGIQRVEIKDLESFWNGTRKSIHPVVFNEWDGMRSRECNAAAKPSALRTLDGRLLFATIRGAVIVDPATALEALPPPPVTITSVKANVEELDLNAANVLVRPRTIEVSYTAVSFLRAGELLFRYRLDGFDEDWSAETHLRNAQYTNLGPGPYVLRVAVRRPHGDWSDEARFSFEIEPAFYQTWLFYVICAALVAAMGRLLVGIGIRHQTRRANELEKVKNELELKNQELGRFTYAVSHDLKSPLFTIEGHMGMVQRDIKAGQLDNLDKDIATIRNAAAHMRTLLDELLELSQIGTSQAPFEPVALSDVAEEAAQVVAGSIAERGVEISIPPDLPFVQGRRQRILQLFQNLIENAVKYMGTQPKPRIEITASVCGDDVTCTVRDNGQGIAQAKLEEIFDVFRQIDSKSDGTGVGLSLVKRIVETHNGTIRAESAGPGQGTAFIFTLPRAEGS